ncbi:hypothetical protein [Bacillus sp. Marseille-P3800]|uniref:hypothetical protein n=1 Tax=Bacillus sp. Marseille-P3800 TaxID=2014782 RepID=UPI000C08684D|nr:hypothetical protein [Bacillus sp. Marseille-P3800]
MDKFQKLKESRRKLIEQLDSQIFTDEYKTVIETARSLEFSLPPSVWEQVKSQQIIIPGLELAASQMSTMADAIEPIRLMQQEAAKAGSAFQVAFNSLPSMAETVSHSLPDLYDYLPEGYHELTNEASKIISGAINTWPSIIRQFNYSDLINSEAVDELLKAYKDEQAFANDADKKLATKGFLSRNVSNIFQSVTVAQSLNDFYEQVKVKINSLPYSSEIKFLLGIIAAWVLEKIFNLIYSLFVTAMLSIPSDAPPDASEQIMASFEELLGTEIVEQVEQEALVTPIELVVRTKDDLNAEIGGFIKEGGHVLLSEVQGEWAFVGYYDDEGNLSEGWVQYKYLISL